MSLSLSVLSNKFTLTLLDLVSTPNLWMASFLMLMPLNNVVQAWHSNATDMAKYCETDCANKSLILWHPLSRDPMWLSSLQGPSLRKQGGRRPRPLERGLVRSGHGLDRIRCVEQLHSRADSRFLRTTGIFDIFKDAPGIFVSWNMA